MYLKCTLLYLLLLINYKFDHIYILQFACFSITSNLDLSLSSQICHSDYVFIPLNGRKSTANCILKIASFCCRLPHERQLEARIFATCVAINHKYAAIAEEELPGSLLSGWKIYAQTRTQSKSESQKNRGKSASAQAITLSLSRSLSFFSSVSFSLAYTCCIQNGNRISIAHRHNNCQGSMC